MKGGFQKFLQLFVVNGYCVFEDNVCVDLSGARDGKPNYANVPSSELLEGPCVDWPKVMNEVSDYSIALLSESYAMARCPPPPPPPPPPPVLEPFGGVAVKVYG